MHDRVKTGLRLVALLLALAVGAGDVALAQTADCTRLASTIRAFDNNRDYRSYQSNLQSLQALGDELRSLNTSFVRNGCQAQINAGQRLSVPCQVFARRITRAQANYASLSDRVQNGQALVAQRQQMVQRYNALQCQSGSSATVTNEPLRRRSFLEQLFDTLSGGNGGTGPGFNGGFNNWGNMSTVRTVCVRSCDGYYWPVSFSTTTDYLQQDAAQCQQQCPNADVQLYYYDNPGQEPSDMVSINGQPYTDLPNAFRYRSEYDASCTCKPDISYGTITVAGSGAQSRAMIDFSGTSFPMPIRDPRASTTAVVAKLIQVPLPRPRPDPEADTPVQSALKSASPGERLVRFGDRIVRIVGPDTPYARVAAKGS